MSQWGQAPSAQDIAVFLGWNCFLIFLCLCLFALMLWGFLDKRIPLGRAKECRASWIGRYHYTMFSAAIAPLIFAVFLAGYLGMAAHNHFRFMAMQQPFSVITPLYLIIITSTGWPVRCVPVPEPNPQAAGIEERPKSPYLGPPRRRGVRTVADIQRSAGRFGDS